MEGVIFVAGIVMGVAAVGVWSPAAKRPGLLMTLTLVVAGAWFVFG